MENEAKYKTGYSNPKCLNKEYGDCSRESNILDGTLCINCTRRCSSDSYTRGGLPSKVAIFWLPVLIWIGAIISFLVWACVIAAMMFAVISVLIRLLG